MESSVRNFTMGFPARMDGIVWGELSGGGI